MKKVRIFTFFGIFIITALLAMNMYNAQSYPGIAGGNYNCYNCHNGPVMAVDATAFAPTLNDYPGTTAVDWGNYSKFSTHYVFVMSVSDPHGNDIEHLNVQFLNNGTHMLVKARMPTDGGNKLANATHADMMAIIWNSNQSGFQLQDFSQNGMKTDAGATPLDMWMLSTEDTAGNTSMIADDYNIDDGGYTKDATQDVSGAIHNGEVRGSDTYFFYFARELDTGDANDVQFVDGGVYQFSIAAWWGETSIDHYSSYDQTLIVGNDFDVTVGSEAAVSATYLKDHYNVVYETESQNVTETTTVDASPSTTTGDGFTVLLVLASIFVAIPVFRKWRK